MKCQAIDIRARGHEQKDCLDCSCGMGVRCDMTAHLLSQHNNIVSVCVTTPIRNHLSQQYYTCDPSC